MRQFTIVAMVLLATAPPAQASAGVSCRAEDRSLTVGVDAAFTRDLGGGLVNFGARLEIMLPAAPADLRKLQFDQSEVSQVWYYDRNIKFELHHARPADGPPGFVDLIIETVQSADEESLYRGHYVLRIDGADAGPAADGKPLEVSGFIACLTE